MPNPWERAKMICFLTPPPFYSQPVSVSISFQIIPLPSLLGRGWG